MPNLEMKYLQIGNQTYQIASSTVPTKTSDLTNDGDGTSAFATMADIGDLGGGTITSVKTTAGAHSTVNITSGAVNFNVPTKTSHLANDSNYITAGSTSAAAVTGISIANHSTASITGVQSSTTSVTGVQSTTTTASKVTLGTAISVPNVTNAGSASNWTFQNIIVPIKASSAVTVPIKDTNATSIPNVTAVGSGSATLSMTMDSSDTKKLNITFSHTHTPPTLGTAISIIGVQSTTTSVTGVTSSTTTASHVTGGGNGTAPTLGTAISIPNVTAATDVTVPIKDTSATIVPIKATSATTVVTGSSHTITDNGHRHTI